MLKPTYDQKPDTVFGPYVWIPGSIEYPSFLLIQEALDILYNLPCVLHIPRSVLPTWKCTNLL